MRRRRIGLGGIWHETNSFVPTTTTLADFESYQLQRHQALLQAYEGTNTELGGAIRAADKLGVEIVPLTFAAAVPSGMVSREAFQTLNDWLLADLAEATQLDGVVLVLHGALAVENSLYPEAELARAVRKLKPGIPVVATLDLHANLGHELAEVLDLVIAYDTFPHVDMGDRGAEAVELVERMHDLGRAPRKRHVKVPLLTAPQMQGTNEEPMLSVMEQLHKEESASEVWTVSATPGYPYSDVDRLGFSIFVAADDHADTIAERLASTVWHRRGEFEPQLTDPEAAIAQASQSRRSGPVILVDVADNVGGGSPGDGTLILSELERRGKKDSVTVIWDPSSVARCFEEPTALTGIDVGGRWGLGPPVHLTGDIRPIGDMVYRRSGAYMTGQQVEMGRVVIVSSGAGDVVLTEKRVMPFDDDHLRVLGLRPESYAIVVVKSASAWKAAFGAYASKAIYVRTPGFCPSDVRDVGLTGPAERYFPIDPSRAWVPGGV